MNKEARNTLANLLSSIKFPTGMRQKESAEWTDILLTQRADNLGGDPETLTLQQVADLLGVGGGGSENPSTDPVFNTTTISKWLKVKESITLDEVIFRVFRDGLKTYLRATDNKNTEAKVWLDLFGAALTNIVCNQINTSNYQKNNSGGALYLDENGASHIEVDYANIRRKATFTELVIQKLSSQGGQVLLTPVNMVIDSVEVMSTGAYKCYARDGIHGFIEFDQARCQKFQVPSTKYYWRAVEAVGPDYVILSESNQDGNGDIPAEGDEIVLLGNQNDANRGRQNAIMLDAASDDSPVIKIYKGINSFDLTGKYVGAFGTDPTNPNNVGIFCTSGRFENITIGPGATGLNNFAEYNQLLDNISKAVSKSVDIMPDPSPAFLKDNEGNTNPEVITIRVSENNFDSDLGGIRRWYYLSGDGFVQIQGQSGKTLEIRPGDDVWQGKTSVSIMYEVEMEEERYSDVTGLIKVSDGQDGVGGYIAVLDNPYVGIASDYNGTIKDGQLGVDGRTRTAVIAYAGTSKLSFIPSNPKKGQFSFSIKSAKGCVAKISPDGTFMYVSEMTSDIATVKLTVNFEGKQYMDLDFNCSVTYDGALSSEEIKGEPGDPAYSMDLDNDSCVVATQPDGTGGYWGENAITNVMVTKGGRDITDKYVVAISANPSTGIDYVSTNNNKTVQVRGMNVDNGFLLFIASPRSSSDPDTLNAPTLQKKFILAKSKQGIQGVQGPGGYVWIVYADDERGTGISLNPTGKMYLGIAYGKDVPNPPQPLNPADYNFSLLTGEGVPGPAGSDLYVWIKFSTRHPITDISQVSNDGQAPNLRYMGIAYNKVMQKEDTFPEGESHTIDPNYYNTTYTWTEYKGKDGTSVQVQYSKDKINWHDTFRVDDIFMRQKMSDGVTWSEAMRVVGESGTDGEYTDFQFAKSSSIETPPTSGWQDGPPSVGAKEFLWMRKGLVVPPALTPESWSTPVVITGPAGASYWIVPDTRFINILSGSPNPPRVRFRAMRGSVVDGVTGWSLGYWKTSYSKDNQKTWQTLTTYTEQLPWIDVDVDPSWTNIKAELYYDRYMTNICDTEIVLIQDVSGAPGEPNYVADLSNESASTNVKNDGTGGYWGENMKTQLRIFFGTENVTNQFAVRVENSTGLTSTRSDNPEYIQVQVTGLSGRNDGYVKFVCVPSSSTVGNAPEITKLFTVTKVPAGNKGDTGATGPQGPQGVSLQVEYSVNGTSGWHTTFKTGDIYMRQKLSTSSTWDPVARIVGEKGAAGQNGTDGSYVDYMFAIAASRTSSSAIVEADWKDAPPTPTSVKPYLWMRTRKVTESSTGSWTTPVCITGTDGQDGTNGEDGAGYWLSPDATQFAVKNDVGNPKTIRVDCKKGMNNSGVSAFQCYWLVQYSVDYMKNWVTLRQPSGGLAASYTITLAKYNNVFPTHYKVSAYFDAAGTILLDSEVIPVINNDLNDISALDYLKHALLQPTVIDGGLISTTYIKGGYSPSIRNTGSIPTSIPSDWVETCGMYGGSTLVPETADSLTTIQFRNKCPRFYGGGNFEGAQASLAIAYSALGLSQDSYTPPTDRCTFAVSDSGILYAVNAYIEGTISSDKGRIGQLVIDNKGLKYGLTGSGDSAYYKFMMYGGGLVFREDWNSSRNSYNRQIGLGASGVLPSSSGLDPLFLGTVFVKSSYSTTTMMYLDVQGGTRNTLMGTGPQAIRVQHGDIHINDGYLTLSSSARIHAEGACAEFVNGFIDFTGYSGNSNGGINFKSPGQRLIFRGLNVISLTGTNPSTSLGWMSNFIVLTGDGSRKKVKLQTEQEIGTTYFIMSSNSQGFDVICSGSEKFIQNGSRYTAVQFDGEESVIITKVDSINWKASKLLGCKTWNE